MKIIRRSVFETNSSSTHALAITKSNENLNKPSLISLDYDGEYGWEYKTLNDLDSKFTYLAILASYVDTLKNTPERIEWYTKRKDIKLEQVELRFFIDKLKDLGFTFKDEEKIISKLTEQDSYYDYYIDHGYEAIDIYFSIISDEDRLKRFLLSPKSFITTGNDNSEKSIWEDPNAEYGLGLTSSVTEWGSVNYNIKPLEGKFEIFYKGN